MKTSTKCSWKPLEYNERSALKGKKIYFIENRRDIMDEGLLVRNGLKTFNVKFDEEEKPIQFRVDEYAIFKNKQDLLDFLDFYKFFKKLYSNILSIEEIQQDFKTGELQKFLGFEKDSLLNDLTKVKQKLIEKFKESYLKEILEKEEELELLKRGLNSLEEEYEKIKNSEIKI
ncbi:hypothetical protein ACOL3H_07020 [Aliarcobacter butzleri]